MSNTNYYGNFGDLEHQAIHLENGVKPEKMPSGPNILAWFRKKFNTPKKIDVIFYSDKYKILLQELTSSVLTGLLSSEINPPSLEYLKLSQCYTGISENYLPFYSEALKIISQATGNLENTLTNKLNNLKEELDNPDKTKYKKNKSDWFFIVFQKRIIEKILDRGITVLSAKKEMREFIQEQIIDKGIKRNDLSCLFNPKYLEMDEEEKMALISAWNEISEIINSTYLKMYEDLRQNKNSNIPYLKPKMTN